MQIVVSGVQVRHGILMLVPEVVEVLGGMVEELEEARKRLVVEVNKPPRGKRYNHSEKCFTLFRAQYFSRSLHIQKLCHGVSSVGTFICAKCFTNFVGFGFFNLEKSNWFGKCLMMH